MSLSRRGFLALAAAAIAAPVVAPRFASGGVVVAADMDATIFAYCFNTGTISRKTMLAAMRAMSNYEEPETHVVLNQSQARIPALRKGWPHLQTIVQGDVPHGPPWNRT